jgi:TPR repeat protein
MVSLGYFYEQGLGVQQSLQTALAHYQNAAKQRNPIACCKLANWCMEGLLEQSDLQQACEYFERAICYEKQDGLIRYLNLGPLDDYQPLGDSAALLLAEVSASIKNMSIESLPYPEEVISETAIKDDTLEGNSLENQWSCRMM